MNQPARRLVHTLKHTTIPKSRITMRFSGFCLLFVLNRQSFFRLPNRTEWCILIFSLHKFHLFRFVLKKSSTKIVPATAASFFGEYISKFAILLLFCRTAADSIPTLFPTLFRHSVYGILRFCGGFYILIIAQKQCGYQEEILRRTSVRRQFRWSFTQFESLSPHLMVSATISHCRNSLSA